MISWGPRASGEDNFAVRIQWFPNYVSSLLSSNVVTTPITHTCNSMFPLISRCSVLPWCFPNSAKTLLESNVFLTMPALWCFAYFDNAHLQLNVFLLCQGSVVLWYVPNFAKALWESNTCLTMSVVCCTMVFSQLCYRSLVTQFFPNSVLHRKMTPYNFIFFWLGDKVLFYSECFWTLPTLCGKLMFSNPCQQSAELWCFINLA